MLNSLTNYTLRICLALLLVASAGAQESTRTPPPILKGGIVHQLRSLSDDAMETLKQAERGSQPTPKQPSPRQQAGNRAIPQPQFPPQPTGRATLRRTNSSPWLERFTQNARDPRDAQTPPSRGEADAGIRLSLTDEPQQQLPIRSATVQADSRGAASGVRSPQPAMLKPEFYGEVHVEEQLPTAVRMSMRDGDASDYNSSSKYDIRDDSDNADAKLFPRSEEQSDVGEDAGAIPLSAPQVSRIPLPSKPKNNTEKSNTEKAAPRRNDSLGDSSKQDSAATVDSRASAVGGSRQDAPRASGSDGIANLPNAATQTMPNAIPRSTFATQSGSNLGTGSQSLGSRNTGIRSTGSQSVGGSDGTPVSVPTQMVATPTAERRGVPELPALPAMLPSTAKKESSPEPSTDSQLSDSTELLPSFQPNPSSTPLPTLSQSNIGPSPSLPLPSLPSNSVIASSPRSSATPQNSPTTQSNSRRVASTDVSPRMAANRLNTAADDLERMKMETPRIEVVLNGPADMPVGTPAIYNVVVTNRDNIDLAGLILRFDVPAGITADAKKPSRGEVDVEQAGNGDTLFTWAFQDLSAGQVATAPIEIVASSPRNFAVAMEWTLMPLNGAAEVVVQSPQLEMLLEGPSEVNYGEANTYRLHVRNVGNAAASNVAVRLSAGPYGASETEIGNIAAGGEETIDVELTFNQQGSIGIEASAAALGDLSCATQIDVLVKQSNLVASIEAPAMIYHGNPAEYRIVISNTGDADARSATAVCTLPAGATVVQLPEGASVHAGRLSWPIANLRAGMAEETLLGLQLASDGENRIHVECSTSTGLATDCWASTLVESIVDLKLTVNDPVAPAPIGSDVLYELTLVNRGSKAGNNVRVVAQFSDGIEPIRGDGQAFRVVPGQLIFEPIARIEAGQSISLKVYARAESEGSHRFRTEVRSDDSELKLVQEETTRYLDTASRLATPTGSPLGRAIVR